VEQIRDDIQYLGRLWVHVKDRGMRARSGELVYEDLPLPTRILRDELARGVDRVLVDNAASHTGMLEFAATFMPNSTTSIELYAGQRPIFDLHGVEEEIGKALERSVNLKSGGHLVIDQTESMTTIDVNTGGFVGHRNLEDTIFRTNLEAAVAIARQLRLRNLGGIIIIDFIDMDTEEHKNAVLNEFRKTLARDRTHMSVNGFTQLGLVEMTRKRTRESLAQVLCEPCPACDGRSRLKTAQTVCYTILRELTHEARQFSAREFRILASQPVVDLFLDEESQALAMLSDFIGKPVSLQVESAYDQEQYDIILM